jgi:hypothetical protein
MGGGAAANVRFEDLDVCSNLKTIVARPLDLVRRTRGAVLDNLRASGWKNKCPAFNTNTTKTPVFAITT